MNVARSSAKFFLSNTGVAFISFLGVAYFARHLGPEAIGIYFLFEAVLRMVGTVSDFGIKSAVEKRISEGGPAGELYVSALIFSIISSSLFSILILLSSDYLNQYFGFKLSTYLVLGLILYTGANLQGKVLLGELRAGETAVINFSEWIVWLVFGFLFIKLGFGVISIVYSLLFGLATKLLWGVWKQDTPLDRPSWSSFISLFNFSKYSIISDIGRYFYNWADLVIIGLLLTTTAVGQYEVAWRVAGVTIILSRAISQTIFPQISQWVSNSQKKEIENLLSEATVWTVALIIPAFFATLLLSRDILIVLFGTEYESAWLVVILLISGKLFQSELIILEKTLQALDRPDLTARATLVGMISNIVLNFALIYSIGLLGAAIATSTTYLISGILMYNYISEYITLRPNIRKLFWIVISSTSMTLLLLGVRYYIRVENIWILLFIISIGVLSFLLFVLIYRPIRADLKSSISNYSN